MRRARSRVITCGSPAKQCHRHGDHGHPSDYQNQCPRQQDALGSFRPPLDEPTGDPNRNDAIGVALGVVIKLFGLAVIGLIDWIWWGSSGRAGLAGVAWHSRECWPRPDGSLSSAIACGWTTVRLDRWWSLSSPAASWCRWVWPLAPWIFSASSMPTRHTTHTQG